MTWIFSPTPLKILFFIQSIPTYLVFISPLGWPHGFTRPFKRPMFKMAAHRLDNAKSSWAKSLMLRQWVKPIHRIGRTQWSTSMHPSIAWNVFIRTEDTPLSFNLPRHGECRLRSFSIVGHGDDSCFPPGCGAPDVPRRSPPITPPSEGVCRCKEKFDHTPSNRFFSIYIHRSVIFFLFFFHHRDPSFLLSFLFFLAKERKRSDYK